MVAGQANTLRSQIAVIGNETGESVNITPEGALAIATTDNELLTSTLAANRKSRVCYEDTAVAGDVYVLLVDLDNGSGAWPHLQYNSIDVDHLSATVTFAAGTAEAVIRVGVITRISETDSDISYLINQRVGAQSANDSAQIVSNFQPSSVTFKLSGANVVGALTSVTEIEVTDVNTATPIPSPAGTTEPAVGDVILKLEYVADTYAANVDVLYHSD